MVAAAKQAAFEEANKIKNQFRSLDDDEIDFLDEVMGSARAEEERIRRETEEGVGRFREEQLRKEREGRAGGDDGDEDVEGWHVGGGKKRKRKDEGGKAVIRGVKRRESGSAVGRNGEEGKAGLVDDGSKPSGRSSEAEVKKGESTPKQVSKPALPAPTKPVGLVAYGSDDEDDD